MVTLRDPSLRVGQLRVGLPAHFVGTVVEGHIVSIVRACLAHVWPVGRIGSIACTSFLRHSVLVLLGHDLFCVFVCLFSVNHHVVELIELARSRGLD